MVGEKREVAKTYVINNAGEFLLLIRSDSSKHRPGGSDILGGKPEPQDSSPEDTARREAREESGLLLADLTYLETVEKKKSITHLFVHFSKDFRPEIILSDEHTDKIWLPGEEFVLTPNLPEKYIDVASRHLVGATILN